MNNAKTRASLFFFGICLVLTKQTVASPPPISYATLDYPGATYTYLNGIQNGNIVGMYALSGNYEIRRGFLYSSGGFTPIDDPNAGILGTRVNDTSGDQIIGSYFDSENLQHGFLYNGTSYQNIDDPLANTAIANSNQALGIFGNTIVGSYIGTDNHSHGYIYDGTQFHTFDNPAGSINVVTAIDGNKMVGTFFSSGNHGYLYDGTTFKTIDDPLANT